jgi:hypothetical protein
MHEHKLVNLIADVRLYFHGNLYRQLIRSMVIPSAIRQPQIDWGLTEQAI